MLEKTIGLIGIGDMGSGLARNLLKAGFVVRGHDLKADRMADFTQMGGIACANAAQVAEGADAAFIMVMNGDEVRDVMFGAQGMVAKLRDSAVIILSATIKPRATLEVRLMGQGDLADHFAPMAEALRKDGYGGAISFESVYHGGDGDFAAGFRDNIGRFKQLFGPRGAVIAQNDVT